MSSWRYCSFKEAWKQNECDEEEDDDGVCLDCILDVDVDVDDEVESYLLSILSSSMVVEKWGGVDRIEADVDREEVVDNEE